MWHALEFEFDGDTVWVSFSDGAQVIQVMADVKFVGRTAVFRGLHIDGDGSNAHGQRALRELINWIKVQLDVDHLRIEGALRISGAGPGRLPSALVF